MNVSMELGHAPRTARHAVVGNEADLTFMLARPALTRWQFETERLRQLAGNRSAAKRRLALLESELGLAQVKALAGRIEPLTQSGDLAVRFEAQETLVALDSVGDQLGSIRERVRENGDPAAAGQAEDTALQVAAAADQAGRPAMLPPAAPAADTFPPQAARFEARYIQHLVGRAAGPGVRSAPVPGDDDGADLDAGQQTDFEAAARERAYFLWEQDGRPDGRADQYWQRAVDSLRRERDGDGRPAWLHPEAPDAFAELAAALAGLCDPAESAPQTPASLPADAGDSLFQGTAS